MINQAKKTITSLQGITTSITALSLVALLVGCSTNKELFATYDKTCDLPPATVKIIEKIKLKDKVVYKDKIIYKKDTTTMPWEPAVYFGFDLDSLNVEESQRLATNAGILKKHPRYKINIQSFTDVKGSTAYNQGLARRRQATVLDYLKTMGVAKQRITVSPLGEELPILGASEHGDTVNRRVELMLLDETGRPLPLRIQ